MVLQLSDQLVQIKKRSLLIRLCFYNGNCGLIPALNSLLAYLLTSRFLQFVGQVPYVTDRLEPEGKLGKIRRFTNRIVSARLGHRSFIL
jgi:hypothetical protein